MSRKRYKTQKLLSDQQLSKEQKQQIDIKHIGKVRISKPTATKDLVAFDFALWFKKDSKEIQIYIDDELQATIHALLEQHGELIIKTNFFSDDVLAITPPSQNAPQRAE